MDKLKGGCSRCLVLAIDTDVEAQSPEFVKICHAMLNDLAFEFAKCCGETERVIRIAVITRFDVHGCRFLEHISEWDFARSRLDQFLFSESQISPVCLGGQLVRLLSLDIVESSDLIDVIWLTSGSISAESTEEVDFWKVVRKMSKFTNASIRMVCECPFAKSDYMHIWRDRLNAELISVSPEDIVARNDMINLSQDVSKRIFCTDVRWRVLVRCNSTYHHEISDSNARLRVKLLDTNTSARGMQIVILKGFNEDLSTYLYDTQSLILESDSNHDPKSSLDLFLHSCCGASEFILCLLEPVGIVDPVTSTLDSRTRFVVIRRTSQAVSLAGLRFDRNHCDTNSFWFLRTILFPPSIRSCLDLICFHNQRTSANFSPLDQQQSDRDPDLDSEVFRDGFDAIRQLPFVGNAQDRDHASAAHHLLGFNLHHACALHPCPARTISGEHIGQKLPSVTPFQPRSSANDPSSPNSGENPRRLSGFSCRMATSPLRVLQQSCHDCISSDCSGTKHSVAVRSIDFAEECLEVQFKIHVRSLSDLNELKVWTQTVSPHFVAESSQGLTHTGNIHRIYQGRNEQEKYLRRPVASASRSSVQKKSHLVIQDQGNELLQPRLKTTSDSNVCVAVYSENSPSLQKMISEDLLGISSNSNQATASGARAEVDGLHSVVQLISAKSQNAMTIHECRDESEYAFAELDGLVSKLCSASAAHHVGEDELCASMNGASHFALKMRKIRSGSHQKFEWRAVMKDQPSISYGTQFPPKPVFGTVMSPADGNEASLLHGPGCASAVEDRFSSCLEKDQCVRNHCDDVNDPDVAWTCPEVMSPEPATFFKHCKRDTDLEVKGLEFFGMGLPDDGFASLFPDPHFGLYNIPAIHTKKKIKTSTIDPVVHTNSKLSTRRSRLLMKSIKSKSGVTGNQELQEQQRLCNTLITSSDVQPSPHPVESLESQKSSRSKMMDSSSFCRSGSSVSAAPDPIASQECDDSQCELLPTVQDHITPFDQHMSALQAMPIESVIRAYSQLGARLGLSADPTLSLNGLATNCT